MRKLTMEEKIKNILASITNGDDTNFNELKGIEAAFIAQETEEIMKLHREVLGQWKNKIDKIINEFDFDPKTCISIIDEHLNGKKETIF